MKNLFQVGEKYCNRDGEYEVISISAPNMVVRYADGKEIETTVALQARILRNIQREESIEEPVQEPGTRPGRPRRRKVDFQGLQETDFKKGVAGTCWRARTSLGGLLAQRMSDTTPYAFQSYAICRRAEVHIVRPECYHKGPQEAKFLFRLDTEGALYGFWVEKSGKEMDDTWDWTRFFPKLEGDAALGRQVETAMLERNLYWRVDLEYEGEPVGRATVTAAQESLTWKWEDRATVENMSWADFANELRAIEAEKWCDLYLCTHMDKDQAIAAGAHIVDEVIPVYQTLLPLYEASIR